MKKLIKIMTALLLLAGLFTAAIPAVDAASSKKMTSSTVMKKIKKSGKLVVGMSADYPPLEFTKNVNGRNKYVGVDVELAKQIAKDLGVKLEIKNMDFDSLLVALETGKIDVIISGMTPTAERKKSIDFSKIYYAESPPTLSSARPTRPSIPAPPPLKARRLVPKPVRFSTLP